MLLETHNFEFHEFLLDPQEKVLLRDGKPLPITPKAFQLLFVLLEKHGHLVEKDELMKSVWADSFVEEGNITFTIGLLRKLLEDDTKNPRFIETVPRRGYRFIAKVQRVEEDEKEEEKEINLSTNSSSPFLPISSSPLLPVSPSQKGAVVALADWRREADESKAEKPAPVFAPETTNGQTAKLELAPTNPVIRSKPKYHAFALAALLVGIIGVGYYFFYAGKITSDAGGKKSITILPLKPINTANRDELYEIGIADSLIHRLSATKSFIVRPLSATRQYTDVTQDPVAAGHEQKTDYVLDSNYQLADGKIRITAQLFNVATGQIEETYKSEKDAGSIFAAQDAIANEVGNILFAHFAAVPNKTTAKRGTANEEAYRLYLQGKNLTAKRNQADAKKAVEYFEQAIRLDPNYALAYVGMAHAYSATGTLRGGRAREAYEKARAAVNKAAELDANSADVYVIRGYLRLLYEWDFAGAEKDLTIAIELEPNNDLAHWGYAMLLNHQGRFEEALAELEIAQEIDPNSLVYQHERGRFFYFARRYDEAIVQLERVLEIDPNFNTSYSWLFRAYEMKGDYAGAFEWFIKNQKLRNPERINDYQKAYETGGWQNVNRKILEFEKLNEQTANNYFLIARQLALLNEKEQAFEYLNKALKAGQSQMATLKVEPAFDSLRDDPRFDQLLRRVGFK